MKRKLNIAAIALVILLGITPFLFAAGDYPTKPITLVNPMAPGGTLDVQARAFAAVAEKYLGQPVMVVNKPGATGMVGGTAVAQASPDGYTLLVGSVNITNAVEWEIANGRTPPFTRNDFAAIGSFTMSPTLLIVPADSPYKTLADFVSDAKTKPGQMAFCSGGLYGMSHLPIEIFSREAGLKFRHVPFTGGGPCLSAVVGKHVDFAAQYPPTTLPLVKGNKLRVLAVVGGKRLKSIPEIPTVKELGIDAEYYGWVGIMAPKNTPAPIVDKLREVTKKVVQDKTFIDMIEKPGDEVYFLGGEELAKWMDKESKIIAATEAELVKEAQKK
ncbi:MAG: tripartite tricarboxylate transporter substrate binding protein [Proteobacteria bacterium]|nr:tripartite tricarboxylate transporter substrate binding protein [Pseudomonadota bacterium]MBU2228078.1 tripartite tricarboxylate transporter substrate binding protein [Pseudomonadota bacterium]MBU2260969.1 tripartite tricarboxylate transporter substrate binding protein [Pseudomonadota bacterium]